MELNFMFTRVFYCYLAMQRIVLNGFVFWDITLCNLLKINRHFGGAWYLHLQLGTCLMLVSYQAYP
jgi:hypothetical protein